MMYSYGITYACRDFYLYLYEFKEKNKQNFRVMKTICIWKNCLSHKSIFFCGRKYGGQKYYLFGTKLCLCHQSVYDTQELNIKPIYHGTHILDNAYKKFCNQT